MQQPTNEKNNEAKPILISNNPPPSLDVVFNLISQEFIPDSYTTLNEALVMIEEGWWFFIDVYRSLYPEFPQMDFEEFVKQITNKVPSLSSVKEMLSKTSMSKAIGCFKNYKTTIPCYGAIILDEV